MHTSDFKIQRGIELLKNVFCKRCFRVPKTACPSLPVVAMGVFISDERKKWGIIKFGCALLL